MDKSVRDYRTDINGFKTKYKVIVDDNEDPVGDGLTLSDYQTIRDNLNVTLNQMNADFDIISDELSGDINNNIADITRLNTKIRGTDVVISTRRNTVDSSDDMAQGAYGLYRDSRRQYDINRQINAVLFFAILILLSFININISYTLFVIMSLYLSVTTLSLVVDMSSILTTLIAMVFVYVVYYIRNKTSISLENPFKKK